MAAADATHRSQQTSAAHAVVPTQERSVTSRPFPSSRRLVTAAVRAGRRMVPMTGLFQVDVTPARRMLGETDRPCR